jgi:hypothetical protein
VLVGDGDGDGDGDVDGEADGDADGDGDGLGDAPLQVVPFRVNAVGDVLVPL